MKLAQSLFYGLLFCFLDTWGMNQVIPGTLSRDTAWVFHCTSLFPQDGVMVPGGIVQLVSPDNKSLADVFLTQDMQRKRAQASLSWIRTTLHWCVNSISHPHTQIIKGTSGEQKTIMVTRENSPFCIAEPMNALQDKDPRGHWQDVFTLGSHTLSNRSVIFVRESNTEYENLIGSFKGRIIRFTGSLSTVIENFLKEQNSPHITRTTPPSAPENAAPASFTEELVIAGNTSSSKLISSMLQLDHVKHDDTALSELERNLRAILGPIQGYLASDYLRNSYDRIKVAELFVCTQCKKSSQELGGKKLLSCARCNAALYCSQDCQKEHWKIHKQRCTTLATALNTCNSEHQNYLRIFETLSTYSYETVLGEITRNFRELYKTYQDSQERIVIEHQERIALHFVHHFYSPQSKYVKKRQAFLIGTLDGFGRYCHAVQDEAENLKS